MSPAPERVDGPDRAGRLDALARAVAARGPVRSMGLSPDDIARAVTATLRRVPDVDLAAADTAALETHLADLITDLARPPIGTDARVTIDAAIDGTSTSHLRVHVRDRPFLLSTLLSTLDARGLGPRRVLHPVLGVERDDDGTLLAIRPARDAAARESVIVVELDGALPPDEAQALESAVSAVLVDVARVTDDHAALRTRLLEVADAVAARPDVDGDPATAPVEVAGLLRWLAADAMVLLGASDLHVTTGPEGHHASPVPGTGLGLLADDHASDRTPIAGPLPAPVLAVASATSRSTVQRRTRPTELVVRWDRDGQASATRIVGLLTRRGLATPVMDVPVLRRRLESVLATEDVVEGSADALALLALAGMVPRDALLRLDAEATHRLLLGLLGVGEGGGPWAMTHIDPASGVVTAFLGVPRPVFASDLVDRVVSAVRARWTPDDVESVTALGDAPTALVVLELVLHGTSGPGAAGTGGVAAPDGAALRALVARELEGWADRTLAVLRAEGGARARDAALVAALPPSYRAAVAPEDAARDLVLLRAVDDAAHPDLALVVAAVGTTAEDGSAVELRVAHRGGPLELSSLVPILESLGLTVERSDPATISPGGPTLELHLVRARSRWALSEGDTDRIAAAILAAWEGRLELDPMNGLVIAADLGWVDVQVLRTYRRLRWQFGSTMSVAYVSDTLLRWPDLARLLVDRFRARFDPDRADPSAESAVERALLAGLDGLTRLDDDRILRGLATAIGATVRTNLFAPGVIDDPAGPCIAVKLDPSLLPPEERAGTFREAFVHGPDVEGVHLRFGPVARGGIRHSDRRDDLRAEVLDLARTQAAKNTVIVPDGAKGGFTVASPDATTTDARRRGAAVLAAYRRYVAALLAMTDDVRDGVVLRPPGVVAHDGDDPYLVVAADRGTATFSDDANAIAIARGFWLGDAFASGGSRGYDHKALGVTARGALAAARRHLRGLGLDLDRDPVTAVGIGDLSGDVFGNAMLALPDLRLLAAFDHRHVFLDPDPDPAVADAERRRVAALPGSTWDDYDRACLGPGGTIVPRDARRVVLSPEACALLRLDRAEVTPPELVRAVLTAPVDLLFAGGIGTFVKASGERHGDVSDRASDDVRVDAADLRARVVVEGANLAVTQAGRVEFARRGGRIDQDAVDNAAGVSTSDREVNLKVLLSIAAAAGRLGPDERDAVLVAATPEVVAGAIGDVDRVAGALSVEEAHSASDLAPYRALIDRLVIEVGLDPVAERLPDAAELDLRAAAGAGLARPELAVLLAWTKRWLRRAILASDLPDRTTDPDAVAPLFPAAAVERFGDLLPRHPLWRELVATRVANDVVDRVGITVALDLATRSGTSPADVAGALDLVRRALGAERWWDALDALGTGRDPLAGAARALDHELTVRRALRAIAAGVLDLEGGPPTVDELRDATTVLLGGPGDGLGTATQAAARDAHLRWLVDDLIDPPLARVLAAAADLAATTDVVAVRRRTGASPRVAADAVLVLGEGLGTDALVAAIARCSPTGDWRERQRNGLVTDLRGLRVAAAVAVLDGAARGTPAGLVQQHASRSPETVALVAAAVDAVGDLDAIAVATRALVRDLATLTGAG